ncbi:hypothetical protein [Flavobacterium pedocola]
MKYLFYAVTITFVFWSCEKQSTKSTTNKKPVSATQIVSTKEQPQDIYIKDKSQYDPEFIKGLASYTQPIKLVDNYILTSNDTTYFPTDLILNKKTVFQGTKDNNKFILAVTRSNLTNLNFEFQLLDKENKIIDSKSGKAILGSLFFFASEIDTDDESGDGYGSSEYWYKTGDCWFSIRIGFELDDNGKQRAKLNYGCEDKNKPALNLDDCPTLRSE